MRRVEVGAIARGLAATVRAGPAEGFAPRIICLRAVVDAPRLLAAGWDADACEILPHPSGRLRWLRRLPLVRRLWPLPPCRTLFVAATAHGLRVTLDGLSADTARLRSRN